MLAILQIPIFDFRSASGAAESKLANPSWPLPLVNRRPFIRRFGKVYQRLQGGVDDWAGEEFYCDATNALQYVALQDQRFKMDDKHSQQLKSIFRRFYSDGQFVNKIELGLRDRFPFLYADDKLPVDLKTIFKNILQLPVKVSGQQVSLIQAGRQLATLFQQATTRHKTAPKPGLVQEGEICLMAIVEQGENYSIPSEAHAIKSFPSIELFGYILYLQDHYIKCWIIRIPTGGFDQGSPANAILRNLRINLMRVHAEKETIKGLLNAVQQRRIDLDSKEVNTTLLAKYLKDTGEKLFSKKRSGIEQESILDFALRSETEVLPGDTLAILVQKLNDRFAVITTQNFVDRSKPMDKKLLLFLCSNPSDKNTLDFGEELKIIQKLHQSSTDRAYFQIAVRTGVEKEELKELLVQNKPDILHIVLHASPVKGLYFQDAQQNAAPMDVEEWEDIIELQQAIRRPSIIILSACNSEGHARAAKPYTDFSAGTTTVFPDQAGIAYARGFYTILFNDEDTGPNICHRSGVVEIKNRKPPFDAINGIDVYNIMQTF
ncbi:CHAT domain-containing protein [Dinghuibacter silviterrae]|uniref:CHAT domain-containing protein n=1 Tax=Dinghuibacter silviterrae TaxID=1539049 RepID=A0A4R8DIQ0_9BACT|nr:hypothetical protein [Dinghuibacter silviterrae]TDW97631.1 hypothetical protein EDB95_5482 [Dinghuibacter silviterrae]